MRMLWCMLVCSRMCPCCSCSTNTRLLLLPQTSVRSWSSSRKGPPSIKVGAPSRNPAAACTRVPPLPHARVCPPCVSVVRAFGVRAKGHGHAWHACAGTVVVTGTPNGIGYTQKPPILLQDGDNMTISISKIGSLTNFVKRSVD